MPRKDEGAVETPVHEEPISPSHTMPVPFANVNFGFAWSDVSKAMVTFLSSFGSCCRSPEKVNFTVPFSVLIENCASAVVLVKFRAYENGAVEFLYNRVSVTTTLYSAPI